MKSFCKESDENVRAAYELLFVQLQQPHAQIRYSALQVMDELFQRSHTFRELLSAQFPDFMNLVFGLKGQTLPPPAKAAHELQTLAWDAINRWHRQFGPAYKQVYQTKYCGLIAMASLIGVSAPVLPCLACNPTSSMSATGLPWTTRI